MILVAVDSCPNRTRGRRDRPRGGTERVAGPDRSPSQSGPASYAPPAEQWNPAPDYGYRRPARRPRRTAGGGGLGARRTVAGPFVGGGPGLLPSRPPPAPGGGAGRGRPRAG